jgi:hypothetical protein
MALSYPQVGRFAHSDLPRLDASQKEDKYAAAIRATSTRISM